MSNEVATKGVFGGKVAVDTKRIADAMEQSAAVGARPDGDYINFSGKRGVYEIGVSKAAADPDDLWVVNIGSFEDGYVCWKGGQPQATRLYPMGVPLPALDRDEHGPFLKDGDGWYDAKAMTLKSVDTGVQGYFKINSKSGVSEFADLQRAITQRIRSGEPCWPVIKLQSETFVSKGFKNSKPVLKIDGWLSEEALETLGELLEDENSEIDMAALYGTAPATASRAKAVEPPKKPGRRGL